jgi:hypothetical protein
MLTSAAWITASMAQQQVFDLFGGDLLAAAVDLIFFAPLHGDVALLVDRNQIAGAVKAVGIKGAGVMLRAVEVAAEGVRPAGHQAPHFAARQRVAGHRPPTLHRPGTSGSPGC